MSKIKHFVDIFMERISIIDGFYFLMKLISSRIYQQILQVKIRMRGIDWIFEFWIIICDNLHFIWKFVHLVSNWEELIIHYLIKNNIFFQKCITNYENFYDYKIIKLVVFFKFKFRLVIFQLSLLNILFFVKNLYNINRILINIIFNVLNWKN